MQTRYNLAPDAVAFEPGSMMMQVNLKEKSAWSEPRIEAIEIDLSCVAASPGPGTDGGGGGISGSESGS